MNVGLDRCFRRREAPIAHIRISLLGSEDVEVRVGRTGRRLQARWKRVEVRTRTAWRLTPLAVWQISHASDPDALNCGSPGSHAFLDEPAQEAAACGSRLQQEPMIAASKHHSRADSDVSRRPLLIVHAPHRENLPMTPTCSADLFVCALDAWMTDLSSDAHFQR